MTNGPDLFGLSEKQLMSLLNKEIKKTKQLAEEATRELHKWSSTSMRTLSIKPPKEKLDMSGFDRRSKLMAAITEEQRKQAKIQHTISKIKSGNFSLNDIVNFDYIQDTSGIGIKTGDTAHDKYSRVMENLSFPADVRATWDSTDVLEIDDIAITRNISYDEAKVIIEQRGVVEERETEDI